VFVVLAGLLAVWALLHGQAAAQVARQDDGASAAPATLPNISRSAAGPRSIIHALRAPGPLCERAFVFRPVVHARSARDLRSAVASVQARHFTRVMAARA